MALDEALLEEPGGPPVLRFYRWAPAALSLGYFQPAAAFDAIRRAQPELAIVRRPTGGGAIHHGGDCTFALAGEPAALGLSGPIPDSYRRVHRAITRGLHRLGFEVALREEAFGAAPAAGPTAAYSAGSSAGSIAAAAAPTAAHSPGGGAPDLRGRTLLCFASASSLDLMLAGRKLCGSAQRRGRGRLLHHGSLVLEPDPLVPHAASLYPGPVGNDRYAEIARALARGFAEEFDVTLEPGAPELRERERAERLERERHRAPSWLRRR